MMCQKGVAFDTKGVRPYDLWNRIRNVMAWAGTAYNGRVMTYPEYADEVEKKLADRDARPTDRRLVYWYGTHDATVEEVPT